jgi:hypothetical protein
MACTVETSCLPAPHGLTCEAAGLTVSLSWTNGHAYDDVVIWRGVELVETVPGDATHYTDVLHEFGSFQYRVTGMRAAYSATSALCLVEVAGRPEDVTCTYVGPGVRITWRNPINLDVVEIYRDGRFLAVVGGGGTEYIDPTPPLGIAQYTLWGRLESAVSAPADCTVPVVVPPPANVECTGRSLQAEIVWEEPVPYEVVRILHDGIHIAEVPGGTGRFSESLSPEDLGAHDIQILGVLDGTESAPVTCRVVVFDRAFFRGETNGDGSRNIADAVYLLMFLFVHGDQPVCMDAADVNGDASLNIADPVYFLSHLMANGPKPPPPYDECSALDPPGSGLGCESFPTCK